MGNTDSSSQHHEEIAYERPDPDGAVCRPLEERDHCHARWLAMQSTYAEYKRSSEALEFTRQTGDDPIASDPVRLMLLDGQQRLAFERYIDARIAFLESRFDEVNRADAARGAGAWESAGDGGNEGESRIQGWLWMVSGRPALQSLGVVLLCTMAFSLMRQQIRVRGLEAGRDDLQAALLRTGHEVQELRERLDASNSRQRPLPEPTRSPARAAPLKPFAGPRLAGKEPRRSAAQRRPPRQGGAASPTKVTVTASRHVENRPISAFSLPVSREFTRVGPLMLMVRSVNPRKGMASLTISAQTHQVDVRSLRLNQPVWVRIAGYDHPLGLVADRMTGNRIEGHLWDADGGKREQRASQSRPRLDSTP